ncbi:MAG: hypothetical protein Harvfovirus4_54 [Harvfovirus sp.]|uniref:RING-type domain-containing protein n=1 Tax=Harvfovirus sp. TaxID=2487768 RepID=A0A3G5A0N4_9VIRU|nr:MAG: hypothetical protein Harvfovirus4_54 [Harvfovirus sp.]
MTVVNNRRRATQQVSTFVTKRAQGTDGADLRAKIKLNESQMKHLEMFKTVDNRTELDVYTVYRCHVNPKYGKVCVETDTPPYLIVDDLIGIGKENRTKDFCLPVFAIQDKNWLDTFPQFHTWLYSSCRYPKINMDNSISPNLVSTTDTYKQVSPIEIFELYSAMFIGTLGEYFTTGNVKYAQHCWRIRWTMTHILNQLEKNKKMTMDELLTNKETLHNLILKRDGSEQNAALYKKFIADLAPAEYYWMMYNLMIEAPDVVHKSNLMNMDLLLCGLLTQGSLMDAKGVGCGCRYEGIQDNILRMIFERAMARIPKIDLNSCVKMDDLVESLHKNAGSSVEGALRYWTFFVKSVNYVSERNYSVNNLVELLEQLRKEMFSLKGITTFCLLIYPDAEKYLCDEVVAEYILSVGGREKKYNVLNAIMLVTKTNTPNLVKVLEANMERMKKVQEKLVLDEKLDYEGVWIKFLEQVKCVEKPNLIHSGKAHVYKQWIIKLASEGDEMHLEILKYFIFKGMEVIPELLGFRRTKTLILRAAEEGSAVMNHYQAGEVSKKQLRHLRANYFSSKSVTSVMLKDFHCDLSALSAYDVDQNHEKPAAIEFIKFEKARELMEEVMLNMYNNISKICTECPICFDEAKLEPLHGDTRHGVCASCAASFTTCPFCRKPLNDHSLSMLGSHI